MSAPPSRRVLIVSPFFPPSSLAGVHRARHLAKHLPAHGWNPTILSVDPRYHLEPADPDLAALLPARLDEVRVGALPAAATRLLGIAGDVGLRGLPHLRAGIARCVAAKRPSVVMITGSPYYPMLLASWIRRRWAVPVVLDFQDPWVAHDGGDSALGWKAWLSRRLALLLEPRAVRAADFITSVSERQNEELAQRHPYLDRSRMAAIPIGGDPDDYAALAKQRTDGDRFDGHFVLSYVGTALPRGAPVLELLFRGVAELRRTAPELARRLRIEFVGTSNSPLPAAQMRVVPLAEAAGVADLVRERPRRVPFLEALHTLAESDAILLVGSDEPHYTASKIYPALMSGRPFLGLFHRASSAHAILSAAGGGIALPFDPEADLSQQAPAVTAALQRLLSDPKSVGRAAETSYTCYTAHAVAGRFAQVFEAAAAGAGRA